MEHRLARRVLAAPVLAATLTVIAGIGGYSLTRANERSEHREAFVGDVAPALVEFSARIERAVTGTSRVDAVDGPSADALAGGLGLEALVLVRPSEPATGDPADAALAAIGPAGSAAAADARPGVRTALETARDTGVARATAPVPAGSGGPVVLVIHPRYRAGADASTTLGRRTGLDAWAVGVLRPAAPAARVLGPLSARGAVQLRDGDVSLYRVGRSDGAGDAVQARMSVGGRTWTVTARPDAGGAGPLPLAVLASALTLAAVMLATGRRAYLIERRAGAEAEAREEDLRAIATIGPLLQQSLDLGEVLPASAAFLADRFDLAGLSVAHVDEDGNLVETFTVGRRLIGVPRRATELRSPPERLIAGEVAAVPLLRGGRIMGALHALAGADLTRERTRTFVSVAEMIGTALANARQFEREQEMVRRLTELDRLKTEFLATVSHELQTPITAILGFSSMLDEQFDTLSPEERRDFVTRVARNATSLSTLVRELLDYSRIGRQHFEVHPEDVDLSELTKRIVDQFETLVDRHEIMVHAPPGVRAMADTEAVERILANLLSNAAKYSPPGTAITVTLAQSADDARIVVDDAGPGVAPDDRAHVFRRFYRGSSPAAVATRGAGIGLSVVKDLVERMGGRVGVGASPEGGARFTVTLPVRVGQVVPPSSESAGQGRTP